VQVLDFANMLRDEYVGSKLERSKFDVKRQHNKPLKESACCSIDSRTIFQKQWETAKLKFWVVIWLALNTPDLRSKSTNNNHQQLNWKPSYQKRSTGLALSVTLYFNNYNQSLNSANQVNYRESKQPIRIWGKCRLPVLSAGKCIRQFFNFSSPWLVGSGAVVIPIYLPFDLNTTSINIYLWSVFDTHLKSFDFLKNSSS